MNLLLHAAYAWAQLINAEYRITVGRKGHANCFRLCFSPEDFRIFAECNTHGVLISVYAGMNLKEESFLILF